MPMTPKYAKYRVKNAAGEYEVVYLETDVSQVEGLDQKFQDELAPLISKDVAQDGRLTALESSTGDLSEIRSDIAANTTAITGEIADRVAGDEALRTDLDAEISRATTAEGNLDARIDGVDTAYKAADVTLGNRISAVEGSIADLGDIRDDISANTAAITKEIGDRVTAVEGVQGEVDALEVVVSGMNTKVVANEGAIAAEITDRTNADGVLDGKITSEVSRATAAEGVLDGKITAMDTAYKAADAANLDAAKLYADDQDVVTLNAAKTHANEVVADLINGAPEHLDTLKELADQLEANENAYDGLLGTVGLKADKTYVDGELAKKANASAVYTKVEVDGKVSTLTESVTDLSGVVTNLEETLTGQINNIDAEYKTADTVMSGRITTLENLVVGGEGEGIQALVEDVAKNTADIATNASNITKEVNDRTTAVASVNTKIDKSMLVVSATQPTGTVTGHVWLEIV